MLAFSNLVIIDINIFFKCKNFRISFFSVLSHKSTLYSSLNQASNTTFMLSFMHEVAKNTEEIYYPYLFIKVNF